MVLPPWESVYNAAGRCETFFYSQAQVYIKPIDCVDWVAIFLRVFIAS